MVKITIGGADYTPVLTGEPSIQDDLNANCRVLNFSITQRDNPQILAGKKVELFYKGEKWFTGELKKQKANAKGAVDIVTYDPLFFLARNTDDFYFKQQTATQIITTLAGKCGIKLASVANTATVFPYLYYPGTSPEKIVIDVLARTKSANGRKFWFRYDPVKDGLILFERKLPANIWAFQTRVNLLDASKTDSIEELYSAVKLVHRESGKEVTKTNADAQAKYGKTQYFEEVNDDVKDVNAKATELLAELSKVSVSMNISAANASGAMPQFYVGDAIYIQEPNTGLGGGYYIHNITQTFKAADLIQITADVTITPELPVIQLENADEEKKKK